MTDRQHITIKNISTYTRGRYGRQARLIARRAEKNMKEKIVGLLLLNFSILFAIDFIAIPASNAVSIGSNRFIYYEDYYKKKPEKIVYRYPEKTVELDSYLISKYLISNKLFNDFLVDTQYDLKVLSEFEYWRDYFDNHKTANKHFELASFYEGMMFCQWLSNRQGKTYRFPTNAEWEYAAMKNSKSIYPFGNKNGLFKSIETIVDTRRSFLDIGSINEDISPFGVEGMFGGNEYVLDSFDGKNYDNFKNKQKNPLMFSTSSMFSIRSGDIRYNENRDDGFGLFYENMLPFDSCISTNSGIRLVEDTGIIFNQTEIDECIFFQNRGKIHTFTNIYIKPDYSFHDQKTLKEKTEVLTLFQTLDKNWLRIIYKEDDIWLTGWVPSCCILLSNKPWYEAPL
ncbi:SUMF1/EgtB/PvdO family nonheme iron enzyme [Treponema sp. HNW]|uniref:formylglycine-generating enzyme family protein n=1 Tax=Treponema sp. HNW TaxID=3116654 RepID=UPI003D0C680C